MAAIGRKENTITIHEQTEKVINQKQSFKPTKIKDGTYAPRTEDPSSLERKGKAREQ
jgi:hypothetical protein